MRRLRPLLYALALVPACAPPVRPVVGAGSGEGPGTSSAAAAEHPQSDADSVPPPPAPLNVSGENPVVRAAPAGGPQLCAATRPDLRSAFLTLELTSRERPETLLLAQHWLQAAWQAEMPSVSARWSAEPCRGAFLCASVSPPLAREAAAALGRALRKLPSSAFFASRPGALSSAEDRDQSDKEWKLQTAGQLLLTDLPLVKKLFSAEPAPQSAQWEALLSKEAGRAYVNRLSLVPMQQAVSRAMASARVTIAGPVQTSAVLSPLLSDWKPVQATPDPAVPRAVVAEQRQASLEKDAGDLSYGVLIWDLKEQGSMQEVHAAFAVLAERWQQGNKSDVRLRLIGSGGLYSLPVIRLDGPHEQVTRAASALVQEYNRLVSAPGAPSRNEWEHARLLRTQEGKIEPRCSDDSTHLPGAAERGLAALRTAGPPVVVMGGTSAVNLEVPLEP